MKVPGPHGCDAWRLLVQLSMSQRASLPPVAAEFELSPAQCHVLHFIEPGRAVPMGELAEALSCDASNVTGLVDRLVVAVSRSGRTTHFTAAERAGFLRALVADLPNVAVDEFDGLVVDHAKRHGARVLFRGLRGARDLDAETEMGWANACLSPGLETVFLVASPETARISSTLW